MSNPPLTLTLSIWQGQTFNDVLTLQDPKGAFIDLTGYTARLMARVYITDALPQISWGTTTGELVMGGTAGTITFNVSASATSALITSGVIANWVYDLLLTSAGGIAERLIQGPMLIYPAVTR